MCGRLVCVLDGPNLALRCRWKPPQSSEQIPQWEGEPPTPSYNLPPTSQLPVLYGKIGDRRLRAMRWGLVPSTYKGELKDFKLSTHNCCGETIMERPLYQRPFKRGFRGVIPANGFFEWNSTKGADKVPHYVHAKATTGEDKPLLMLAALYDKSTLPSGETFYSVTVVTVKASESIGWLHHRMPALLDGPDEVHSWLHTGSIMSHTLLPLLYPRTTIALYPVSKAVNNVQTQGPQCIEEMAPIMKKAPTTLEKFFGTGSLNNNIKQKFQSSSSPHPSEKRKVGTLEKFYKKRKLSEEEAGF